MSFEIKRARGKTAVFSGTKQRCDFVPRLEDLCIRKLVNNVNRIECVGDVPYYVLAPLLTKISPSQLKRIEAYNPQLVEDPDSDAPWSAHCSCHFPNHKRQEGETWRELFNRCERERDNRIEKIAKRIKRHEEKAIPARQVKVVDNQIANHRRGALSTVIKKTIKNHIPINGTGHRQSSVASSLNGSPSSASSSSSRMNNTTTTTTTRVVVRREAGNGSSGSKLLKPKTAPLMQKSLQLFKSRFRR